MRSKKLQNNIVNFNVFRIHQELWRRGELSYKLHEGQIDLYHFLNAEVDQKIRVLNTSRRFGKTYTLSLYAIELCLKKPGIVVPYVAPTIKALKTIVRPIFSEILKDCPASYLPMYKTQDSEYTFHNGSRIILAGANNQNAEKLRGIKAHYFFIDEAGFIADLQYLIRDILTPTLMYTDGFGIVSSTPPPTLDHYFCALLADATTRKLAMKKTIWDNPMLKSKEILDFAEASGCTIDWDKFKAELDQINDREWIKSLIKKKSISFRREYEAEIIADPTRQVVPEFDSDKQAKIVKFHPLPEYYFSYTVMDTGFVDKTGIIFGYYDFQNAKCVVVDEILADFRNQDVNLDSLVKDIQDKEKHLFENRHENNHFRFADGDLILLNELGNRGMYFSPVTKDNVEAQVNELRIAVQKEGLIINPICDNTIIQLRFCTWDKRRSQFERTEANGHYDLVASLIYFVRHIDKYTNPYPEFYQIDTYNTFIR